MSVQIKFWPAIWPFDLMADCNNPLCLGHCIGAPFAGLYGWLRLQRQTWNGRACYFLLMIPVFSSQLTHPQGALQVLPWVHNTPTSQFLMVGLLLMDVMLFLFPGKVFIDIHRLTVKLSEMVFLYMHVRIWLVLPQDLDISCWIFLSLCSCTSW